MPFLQLFSLVCMFVHNPNFSTAAFPKSAQAFFYFDGQYKIPDRPIEQYFVILDGVDTATAYHRSAYEVWDCCMDAKSSVVRFGKHRFDLYAKYVDGEVLFLNTERTKLRSFGACPKDGHECAIVDVD